MMRVGSDVSPERLSWMAQAESGKVVSHAQLVFDWVNGVAVAPEHRGQGFAVPVVRAVLRRAFEQHAIERAELNVFSWNGAAIRAYSKAGFLAGR
jgi:RimJ/RimL family protein N-acetyltransferase